jgi:SAM-dependent methyltransferase
MAGPTAGYRRLIEDYRQINRLSWDERAPAHAASPDYALQSFVEDPGFLSHVVRFDVPLLGDVSGLRAVHLQCHIGTDTISLARLGAEMTGLDLSPASLAEARALAERVGAPIEFVEGEVYDAVSLLGAGRFELVYTGVGALCWLPSIERWAAVVSELLAPGGRMFIREGHPMLWTLDESSRDALVVAYPYFETEEPYVDDSDASYVETAVKFEHTRSLSWNHGLGEVIGALLDRGMEITGFVEHDTVPWDPLPGQTQRDERGEYRLTDRPRRLAASYTLQAIKPLH